MLLVTANGVSEATESLRARVTELKLEVEALTRRCRTADQEIEAHKELIEVCMVLIYGSVITNCVGDLHELWTKGYAFVCCAGLSVAFSCRSPSLFLFFFVQGPILSAVRRVVGYKRSHFVFADFDC